MNTETMSIDKIKQLIRAREMEIEGLRHLLEWLEKKELDKAAPAIDTALWRILLTYR